MRKRHGYLEDIGNTVVVVLLTVVRLRAATLSLIRSMAGTHWSGNL